MPPQCCMTGENSAQITFDFEIVNPQADLMYPFFDFSKQLYIIRFIIEIGRSKYDPIIAVACQLGIQLVTSKHSER